MDLNVALAPGCYGMGLLFKEGSTECASCPFASSCRTLGDETLATMRAELGVVAPVRQAPAAAARPQRAVLVQTDGLPKKVAAWMEFIERSGIKVTAALAQGVNPFAGRKPTFLNIACLLLLKCPNGVSRDMLRHAFTTRLSWSAETAASHITQTRQILAAIGAVDDVDGLMKLRSF